MYVRIRICHLFLWVQHNLRIIRTTVLKRMCRRTEINTSVRRKKSSHGQEQVALSITAGGWFSNREPAEFILNILFTHKVFRFLCSETPCRGSLCSIPLVGRASFAAFLFLSSPAMPHNRCCPFVPWAPKLKDEMRKRDGKQRRKEELAKTVKKRNGIL